jgi:hypothetical protein
LKIIETVHATGVMHGDIKVCAVFFPEGSEVET